MRDEMDMRMWNEHGAGLTALIGTAVDRVRARFARARRPAPDPAPRPAEFAICGDRLCGASFQRWY